MVPITNRTIYVQWLLAQCEYAVAQLPLDNRARAKEALTYLIKLVDDADAGDHPQRG